MEENLRQHREKIEHLILSPYAAFSDSSKGRERPEAPCDMRTEFIRDRDRIIHCKTFRRLKHKTQVFLSPEGDHYRTRLTHTLEVCQIARTIARALDLNEDLAEAIALGHDLGHTPFGHAGERVLAQVCSLGFKHYEQSVRVVEKLEKDGRGLNLTHEVRNGILCHTSGTPAETLEGQLVRFADKIAYMNHDIEDAVRGGVIEQGDIPAIVIENLGDTKSKRINTLVRGVISASRGKDSIQTEDYIAEPYKELHDFLFDRVYLGSKAKAEEKKAENIVEMLYGYYIENPEKMNSFYRKLMETEGKERAVCDFVAGMTDRYAMSKFEEIYIPKIWSLK